MLRTVWAKTRGFSWSMALSAAASLAVPPAMGEDLLRLPDEPITINGETPVLPGTECDIVKERYPSGKLKIERTVTLDTDDNFVNHGAWTMWDEQGRTLGGGEYAHGRREGKWVRHFHQGDADVLAGPLAKKFQAPFTAEASFSNDKLHGTWTMIDGKQRVVFAWTYENGRRHGKSVWCYPNGQPWREATYVDGLLDGDQIEIGPDQALVRKDTFRQGRQITTKVEWHAPGVKKLEGTVLMACDSEGTIDDFWSGVSLPSAPTGPITGDERHGPWTTWHRNGQVSMQGSYNHDQPEGVFVWYHANGQKAIEGNFSQGQQTGSWTWWHTSGIKEMRGTYLMGLQAGKWNRWDEQGKLAEALEFPETGAPAGVQSERALVQDETTPTELPATSTAEAPSRMPRVLKRR